MSTPHKPRRKRRGGDATMMANNNASEGSVVQISKISQSPAFPLAAYFWSARKSTSQWTILPLTLMAAGLFRWAVGLWGYSGFETPPMHGDFEAQRHWMEITSHLPISKWYFYDLQYWGLDYPPLTAYHSWLLGRVGSLFDTSWFALDKSRQNESLGLKLFMRSSVIVSEYLLYIPAVVIFNRIYTQQSGLNTWSSSVVLAAILFQPSTILIDHGHFQFNTVMLGFVLATMASFLASRHLLACIFFVAALSFKQMALYYAPVVFTYLLGICLVQDFRPFHLSGIVLTTLFSFTLIFTPLALGTLYSFKYDYKALRSLEPPALLASLLSVLPPRISRFLNDLNSPAYHILVQITQSIHRIFPLARGLFEDKVANFWCSLHTVHKLTKYSTTTLSELSLLTTLAAITPACLSTLLRPSKARLPFAMASCAWGFFLFSFQVHEKSVLLPLLPMTVLLGSPGGLGPDLRSWVGFANILGAWTIFPLLKRDQLRVPYAVLTLFWTYALDLPPVSIGVYGSKGTPHVLATAIHLAFYATMVAWHIVEAFVESPNGKPDLWVVINGWTGAAGFLLCYVWCTWYAIDGAGLLKRAQAKKPVRAIKEVAPDISTSSPAKRKHKKRKSLAPSTASDSGSVEGLRRSPRLSKSPEPEG